VSVVVEPGGELKTGCYVAAPVGNVLERPVGEILRSEEARRSALKMFRLDCPTCTCGYGITTVYTSPLRSARYLIRRVDPWNLLQ